MVSFRKLSTVILIYNEARAIHQLLELLCEPELMNDLDQEIILVNACSADDAAQGRLARRVPRRLLPSALRLAGVSWFAGRPPNHSALQAERSKGRAANQQKTDN